MTSDLFIIAGTVVSIGITIRKKRFDFEKWRRDAVVFALYAEKPSKDADVSATSSSLLPPCDHQHISVVRRVLNPSSSQSSISTRRRHMSSGTSRSTVGYAWQP